jgi:hypothetical protein
MSRTYHHSLQWGKSPHNYGRHAPGSEYWGRGPKCCGDGWGSWFRKRWARWWKHKLNALQIKEIMDSYLDANLGPVCKKCRCYHQIPTKLFPIPFTEAECDFNPDNPCSICGKPVCALSFGGPNICPSCDCGRSLNISPQLTQDEHEKI